MNDQILDDLQVEPIDQELEMPLWKYRAMGTFRILISFLAISMIIGASSDVIRYFSTPAEERYSDYFDLGWTILTIIFILLLIPFVLYYINQGWVELRRKNGFSKKRRFRVIGMIVNCLFIIFLFVPIVLIGTQILDPIESFTDKVFMGIGILIIMGMIGAFISILRIDYKYFKRVS